MTDVVETVQLVEDFDLNDWRARRAVRRVGRHDLRALAKEVAILLWSDEVDADCRCSVKVSLGGEDLLTFG
jgi:hypothetical protein